MKSSNNSSFQNLRNTPHGNISADKQYVPAISSRTIETVCSESG